MMVFNDPLQFWSIFSDAMNENPPPEREIKSALPQFKYLWIELGKQWKPENVNPLLLAQMKTAAANVGARSLGFMPLGGNRSTAGSSDRLTSVCLERIIQIVRL